VNFKVKPLHVSTGNPNVIVLNYQDARELTFHRGDRIRIKEGRNEAVAVVDTTNSEKVVPRGCVGLMDETKQCLNFCKEYVELIPEPLPSSIEFIKKKLQGKRLTFNEYYDIIEDIVKNKLTAQEIAYFISACYTNPLNINEISYLTKSVFETGDIFKLDEDKVMDKHCIGGVPGNRTTMIVVPIIAASGLYIPKTSSRAITSPAGTADTMEVLSKISFPLNEMKNIVKKTNGCLVWGGSLNLVPADDKLIEIEKPLALDVESLLLTSILAKKKSVSATHVLIDIPYGEGAKIISFRDAVHLRNMFISLAKKLDIKLKVVLTDGSQPIGNGIGPLLEARDVLYVLKRDEKRPLDLEKKSIYLAGKLLELGGKAKRNKGEKVARDILNSGKAYKKFEEIVHEQKGLIIEPDKIKLAKYSYDVKSNRTGKIISIDNKIISRLAVIVGAPKDKKSGLYLYKHKHNKVRYNEILYTIYSESKDKLNFALKKIKENNGYKIK
jgi:putative thymidine phosphorylase